MFKSIGFCKLLKYFDAGSPLGVENSNYKTLRVFVQNFGTLI